MSSDLPCLFLKAQSDKRIKRGHLWVYSNEVDVAKSPLKQFVVGQQVAVCSASGKALGVAFVNPNNLICARMVGRQLLDQAQLLQRIRAALALRERSFSAPYYRLVYGDSDLLPGLVVDRFGDYLVVQISSAGMHTLQDAIISALQTVCAPKGILLRNDHSGRALEGLDEEIVEIGEVPDLVELEENGTRFLAPVKSGQKTGWFYDHRLNRQQLQAQVKGARVLDVFSYIGGWGVQAVTAGAAQAVCVDSSAEALNLVNENAQLNGVADKVECIEGNAIQVLKTLILENEKFDVVVLDPPAFIKRRKDQKKGEAAYRHITELGLRLLGRDGLLVSASCSMHLDKDVHKEIVRAAGRHLERHTQIIYQGGQGPDHPVHPGIPETDYIKSLFVRSLLV